jgi:hypothetical protein
LVTLNDTKARLTLLQIEMEDVKESLYTLQEVVNNSEINKLQNNIETFNKEENIILTQLDFVNKAMLVDCSVYGFPESYMYYHIYIENLMLTIEKGLIKLIKDGTNYIESFVRVNQV